MFNDIDRWIFVLAEIFVSNISAQSCRTIPSVDDFLSNVSQPKWRTFWWHRRNPLLLPLLHYYYYYYYYCNSSSAPETTTDASQHLPSKWQALNPCLPPFPLRFIYHLPNSTHISSSLACPSWNPAHLCKCVGTHCHRHISLAFLHMLGVDSKQMSKAPRNPKLLSPPVSSSCARFSSHSEA